MINMKMNWKPLWEGVLVAGLLGGCECGEREAGMEQQAAAAQEASLEQRLDSYRTDHSRFQVYNPTDGAVIRYSDVVTGFSAVSREPYEGAEGRPLYLRLDGGKWERREADAYQGDERVGRMLVLIPKDFIDVEGLPPGRHRIEIAREVGGELLGDACEYTLVKPSWQEEAQHD